MSVRKHDNLSGSGCDRSCCLKVAHLGVSMGDQVILEDVNFHLHCGEITALIGPNGAGKSTTLRAILNLIRPDGGTVKVFGRAVSEAEPDFKEDIGVVLDEASFHDPLKAPQVQIIIFCCLKQSL